MCMIRYMSVSISAYAKNVLRGKKSNQNIVLSQCLH